MSNQHTRTIYKGTEWVARTSRRGRLYLEFELTQDQGYTRPGVDHKPYADPYAIHLTFAECYGPLENGSWRSCGAGVPDLLNNEWLEIHDYQDGWQRGRLAEVGKIAAAWHLNDMQAGCIHQQDGPYSIYQNGRSEINHPIADQVCPETGYKYGSAWLYKPVDPAVVNRLLELWHAPIRLDAATMQIVPAAA